MIIETDTQIHTLLELAEHIHDQLAQLDGCNGWTQDMTHSAIDYKRSFERFKEDWTEARRERNAL